MVWQYLNGEQALNLSALLKFSRSLHVSPRCISPTLSAELEAAGLVHFHEDAGKVSFEMPSEPDPLIKEAISLLKQVSPSLRAQAVELLNFFVNSHRERKPLKKGKSHQAIA